MSKSAFDQAPYRCRFDWGLPGIIRAAKRGNIIVLVDTLSFSTAVIKAVSKGAIIIPCAEADRAGDIAAHSGAEVAVSRTDVPDSGQFSLSPDTFNKVKPGTRIVLPSLNGGTCLKQAVGARAILIGGLVNANSVGRSISDMQSQNDLCVTVIACGEREKGTGELRPAIEDTLGAGAILSSLDLSKSPEALVCEAGFLSSRLSLPALLWDSVSGRELRESGFGDDVVLAANLNSIDSVPVLRNGELTPFE